MCEYLCENRKVIIYKNRKKKYRQAKPMQHEALPMVFVYFFYDAHIAAILAKILAIVIPAEAGIHFL